LKILDELQWQKVNLVGHSMGGRNALEFAHEHPERLQSLVIEDIGPEGTPWPWNAPSNGRDGTDTVRE